MGDLLKILIVIISFVLLSLGIYSAIVYGFKSWFTVFIIPMYIFISSINYILKNKTTIKSGWKNFLKIYLLYFTVGASIEFVGYFLFKFWYFPEIKPATYLLNVLIVGYPMPLFVLSEVLNLSYYVIKKLSKKLFLKIALSMAISTFIVSVISEYPNLFAYEWVYQNLPFTGILIFGTDALIIVGWIILTCFSVSIITFLKIRNTSWVKIEVSENKK